MEVLNPCADGAYPAKTVAYSGSAGNTGTWDTGADAVLVWATTDAYIAVGDNVTASTSSTPIPANVAVPFKVPNTGSGNFRVSAIQVSAGGNVYAKPMNRD